MKCKAQPGGRRRPGPAQGPAPGAAGWETHGGSRKRAAASAPRGDSGTTGTCPRSPSSAQHSRPYPAASTALPGHTRPGSHTLSSGRPPTSRSAQGPSGAAVVSAQPVQPNPPNICNSPYFKKPTQTNNGKCFLRTEAD